MGIVGAAGRDDGTGGRRVVVLAEGVGILGAFDDGSGVVGGGLAPNIRAKRASLYTQMAMFTVVVAINLAGPGVMVEKDWLRSVEVTVSIAFAVR